MGQHGLRQADVHVDHRNKAVRDGPALNTRTRVIARQFAGKVHRKPALLQDRSARDLLAGRQLARARSKGRIVIGDGRIIPR